MIHESRDSRSHGPVHQTRRKNCIQGNPRRGQYQSKSIHAQINQGHYPNRKFSLQNLWFRGLHLQAVPSQPAVQPLKYGIPKHRAHSYTNSCPPCRPKRPPRFPQTRPSARRKSSCRLPKRCLIYVFSYRSSYYCNMYTPYRTYRIYCFYFNHIRSSAKNQPIFLSSFLNFTLLFTTRIRNPHSRFLWKCGFNLYEFIRFSYGLKRISLYRCRRRSQTESSSCRQNQNFPPPPPWVVPEDDVCVAEPPEESLSFGFAVRFTCE